MQLGLAPMIEAGELMGVGEVADSIKANAGGFEPKLACPLYCIASPDQTQFKLSLLRVFIYAASGCR